MRSSWSGARGGLDGRDASPPRVDRASPEYKKAFDAYLRHGEPIDVAALRTLEGKAGRARQDHPTTHYIWRTQGDGRVRPSHAANDGRVFAWDDPPPTGHPGEDYGCRCWPEPYVPDTAEFFNIEMRNVKDEGPPWDERWGFVWHYFFGGGRTVTVRETGYLKEVVDEFMHEAGDVPTRLPGQIADAARIEPGRSFKGTFGNTYEMTDVAFSIGHTTIEGTFRGTSTQNHGLLVLRGAISFELSDAFRDPADIEQRVTPFLQRVDVLIREADADGIAGIGAMETYLNTRLGGLPLALTDYVRDRIIAFRDNPDKLPTELGGTPYRIVDRWRGTFSGKVLIDRDVSAYKRVEP